MATKYEHVSSGAGFSVLNGATKTSVISQSGVLAPTSLDPSTLQIATVNLTAANIIAMYAAPVAIIPAVSGKKIILDSLVFTITRTATAFTGGGVVDLQYNSTANGAGTTLHADIAATVVTGAAGTTHTVRVWKDLSDVADASITNIGVYISNKTAAFAAGTGTATLKIKYYLA